MQNHQSRTVWIAFALALLMAATRLNHFGTALALPDASYAIFFLGGLYLARARGALAIMALLLVEAALVDYYAINFRGISGWCVTSAYGFLVLAYGSLWYVGRAYAPRYTLTVGGLRGLLLAAVLGTSLAFIIANVSFYLLAGYFPGMSALEYSTRVAPYYGSYVAVAVMYIGGAVILQMVHALWAGRQHKAA